MALATRPGGLLRRAARTTVLVQAVLLASLLLAGCGRDTARPVERLAVITSENLSSGQDLDWVGYATASVVVERLAGAPAIHAKHVRSVAGAMAFRATKILHSYYDAHGDTVRLRAVVEDLDTNRQTLEIRLEAKVPDELLSMAGELTRAIAPPRREYSTANPLAIRVFGEGLAATSIDDRFEAYSRAVEEDPEFEFGRLHLAQVESARGNRDEARLLIESAPPGDDEIGATRSRLLLATLTEDAAGRAAALDSLARLLPADSDAAVQAAQALLRLHRYGDAADWYGRAATVEPARADFWNSRAYPLAWSGDFEGAIESLRRYQEGEPANPNVLDSFGEIYFRFGDYSTAERNFLDAHDAGPEFQESAALVKAARCRLLRGDREGADELFAEYVSFRTDVADPLIEYRRAQWIYETGRRDEAASLLAKLGVKPETPPQLQSLLRGQLAVWALLGGDREEALRQANQGLRSGGRVTAREVVLARFLVEERSDGGAWEALARQAFPGEAAAGLRREAMVYALLLSGAFADARPLLEAAIAAAPPYGADWLRVLLGWALIETGELEQARELLAVNPTIQPGTESILHSLIFPRVLYLRGLLADDAGDRPGATQAYSIFLQCSGDAAGRFGYEEKARARLSELGR